MNSRLVADWKRWLFVCGLVAGVLVSGSLMAGETRVWDGEAQDELWSSPANWSGDAVPVSGDDVILDGTSTKNCTIDAAVSVESFSMNSGYTGTVSASNDLTVTGAATIDSGTFSAESATHTFEGDITLGAGGTFEKGTSTVILLGWSNTSFTGDAVLNNLVVNKNNRHVTVTNSITVEGTLTLSDGYLDSGDVKAGGGVIQETGFDGGSGTLVLDGAADQTVTGSGSRTAGNLPNINMNKAGGTLTLSSTIRTGNDWTYTQGALDSSAATVVFGYSGSAGKTITGSHTLTNVLFDSNSGYLSTWAIASGTTLTVSGTLTFDNTSTGPTSIDGDTLAAQGDIVVADGRVYRGTATLLINGSGDQTFTGSATQSTGEIPNVVIEKPSGKLTLSGTIRTGNNWAYRDGNLHSYQSTVVFGYTGSGGKEISGSHSLDNVIFDSNSGWVSYWNIREDTYLCVEGQLTLDNTSTGSTQINGGTIAARADILVADALKYCGTGTILIGGVNDQTLTGNATQSSGSMPNVAIDKPGGTLTLAGTIRTGGHWTYRKGTLDASTSVMVFGDNDNVEKTIQGSHTLNDVVFDSNCNWTRKWEIERHTVLTVASDLVFDNTNTGAIQVNTGTIVPLQSVTFADSADYTGSAVLLFSSAAGQIMTGNATESAGGLPNVEVDKTAGSLTLSGTFRTSKDWTYKQGAVDPGSSTVVLAGNVDNAVTGDAPFCNLKILKVHISHEVTFDGDIAASGDFVFSKGALTLVGKSKLSVGGVLTFSSSDINFHAEESCLSLNGTSAQAVNLEGHTVNDLKVENTQGVVTFAKGFTAKPGSTFEIVAGGSVKFQAAETFALDRIAWNGTSADPISLRSTTDAQQWKVSVVPYQVAAYVDVMDSDASEGYEIRAVHSTDSGNNLNWLFQDPAPVQIGTSAASRVSPAWVEGTVGPDAVSIEVSVDGGDPFDAVRQSPTKWYADNGTSQGLPRGIVLSATQDTSVQITAKNEAEESSTENQVLQWSATDMAESSWYLTIRKGDSLLLTATGEGTNLEIDADGNGTADYTGSPGDEFAHQYGTAGTYAPEAFIDGQSVGTITVVVFHVDLKGPIACEVDYQRRKNVIVEPASELQDVTFGVNDAYWLETSVYQTRPDGARLNIMPLHRGTPILQARLGGESGPIAAEQEIDEFTVQIIKRCCMIATVRERIARTRLIMHPYIADIDVEFDMRASQCTFIRNGEEVTLFTVNTSGGEFEQVYDEESGETLGEFIYEIYIPEGENQSCYLITFKQTGSGSENAGSEGLINPPACIYEHYNSLIFIESTSDEWEEESEEWWQEKSVDFVVEDTPGDQYMVHIYPFWVYDADPQDRPEPAKEARFGEFLDGTPIREAGPVPCAGGCHPAPPCISGIKNGIYQKRPAEPAEDENQSTIEILVVAKADANGPDLAVTTDPFPKVTGMLEKRSGILIDSEGNFVGEPVIKVVSGGERVGGHQPSFYGLKCNGTSQWVFEAKAEGYEESEHDVKWYLNGGEPVSTSLQYTTAVLDPGRYVVRLEFTEEGTANVIASAEIHSLVVEQRHSESNAAGKPDDVPDPVGAKFELRGEGHLTEKLDLAVYALAGQNGARGRVSLDGWCICGIGGCRDSGRTTVGTYPTFWCARESLA